MVTLMTDRNMARRLVLIRKVATRRAAARAAEIVALHEDLASLDAQFGLGLCDESLALTPALCEVA